LDPTQRFGSKNGFDEILSDPFFSIYKESEVNQFMYGKDISLTSFKDNLSYFDAYLEDACRN
jgi:hypothetical protein